MQVRTRTADVRESRESEWHDAELAERVELLRSQAHGLEAERERLQTELLVARSWVEELALWLDEAQARTGGTALPATKADDGPEAILSPRTLQLLHERPSAPVPWDRVARVAALGAIPWGLIGGLAYLIWLLVS